jgi:hypothetical protein
MLRTACRASINFAAATRQGIDRLHKARRGAVNFHAHALWQDPGELGSRPLARVPTGRVEFTKPPKRKTDLQVIGFGALNGSQTDKSKSGCNTFGIAAGPWICRQMRRRSGCLPSENRIRPIAVDPRGTFRTCRGCDEQDRRNREWETFGSIVDERSDKADFIGARNVTVGSVAMLGQ